MARQETGTEVIVAIKKAAAWGDPVVLGAGDGLWILDEGIEVNPEILYDESLGNAFTECADLGNIVGEGDFNALLKYEGLLLPIALLLGEAGVPALITNGQQHYLKCANNTEGLFATFAVDKVLAVHENPSMKIAGFTISGSTGDFVRIAFMTIVDTLDTESIVNTLVTMPNVTYPAKCLNIVMNNGVFLLKDQGGIAPADPGDRIYPSEFELSFDRNISGDNVADGGRSIIEPQQDGQPEITLSLTFPRYTSVQYIRDLFAKQQKEMIVTWTGAVIGGGPDTYQFSIELPNLVISDDNIPAAGLGKMPHTVNFRCLRASAIPTGFQDNEPITVGFVNSIATNPFGIN